MWNEKRYKIDKVKGKENNKKRVKIEHIFAYMKNYRILRYGNNYDIKSWRTYLKQ